jgi:hypothetical protein
MNAVEFVAVIEKFVRDASVADSLSIVRNPPGRRPPPELVKLSEWYNRLGGSDQAMVERMLEVVARQAVFGFLSVLDGARQVEPGEGPKGDFELRYIKDGKAEVISGPSVEALHELLR